MGATPPFQPVSNIRSNSGNEKANILATAMKINWDGDLPPLEKM